MINLQRTLNIKILVSSLLLILISVNTTTAVLNGTVLEYLVSIDDSVTYEYKKIYDVRDGDGDGDPNTNSFANVTVKPGTKLIITVINLTTPYLTITENWNNIITYETEGVFYISKTVDNLTYWQEFAETYSEPGNEYSIEGEILIRKTSTVGSSSSHEGILKKNWKTGWVTSYYKKTVNETTNTIIDEQYFVDITGQSTIQLDPHTIFAGVSMVALFGHFKRRREKA